MRNPHCKPLVFKALACVLLLGAIGCSRNQEHHSIQHLAGAPAENRTTPAAWPVEHPVRVVTSGFGMRHSSGGSGSRMHNGVDMTVPVGTPVVSTADGVVGFSGTQRGYGEIIIVDHGEGIQTAYAHLHKRKSSVGDWVRRGQVIGLAGQTGNATGPHVHYEVRINGRFVDPMPYLPQ